MIKINKKYAISDLHGMWELWEQIKNYCDESDIIYFLGDANDRGKDGIKIIQDLLKDSRVVYLKGNHEEMLINVGERYLEMSKDSPNNDFSDFNYYISLLFGNGGGDTYSNFLWLPREVQEDLISRLSNLPLSYFIKNKYGKQILLCHAGTDPNYTSKELQKEKQNGEPYLWDRNHIYREWNEKEFPNLYIIHGHTPTSILKKRLGEKDSEFEVYYYANNHKIAIDLGSFITKKIALFDLDTLKVEKYFEIIEEKENN